MTRLKRVWRWLTDADAIEHEIEVLKRIHAYEVQLHQERMAAHQKRAAAREIYMID